MKRILLVTLFAACLVLLRFGPAAAKDEQAVVGAQVATKATVESIDVATRKVLLRNEDGSLETITVGPEARNLAQVKPGDHVLVRIRLGVVARLAPPGDSGPAVAAANVTGRAPAGEKPAGIVGDALRVRVTFNSYDKKAKVVHFTLPDGTERQTVLRTKEMQDFAAGLKTGDKVDVTFLRSFAVAVEPA